MMANNVGLNVNINGMYVKSNSLKQFLGISVPYKMNRKRLIFTFAKFRERIGLQEIKDR